MKCPACGYYKHNTRYTVEEVVRYKSGSKKGQIKGSQTRTIEPFGDYPDFKELEAKTDNNDEEITIGYRDGPWRWSFTKTVLVMCPECSNVFVGHEC